MQSLITRIHSTGLSKTAKNIYLVFVGNGFNALLGFITMVLVSRNLGPENFGVFSISLAVYMGAAKLSDLGLNFAAARYVAKYKNKEQKQAKYINITLKYKLILVFIVTFLGILISPFLAVSVFKNSFLTVPLRLAFWMLFGLVLFDYYLAVIQAKEEFGKSILVGFVSSIFKLSAVYIVIKRLMLTSMSSFVIYGIGPILGFLLALYYVQKGHYYSLDKRQSLDRERKEVIDFSKWMGISVLVTSISERLDIFMISNMLGSYDTGIYSASSRFAMLFSILIGALGIVLVPKLSSVLKKEDLKRYLQKVPILIAGLFVILLGVIIIAPWLFKLTIGDQYKESVNIFRVLSASMIFLAASTPLSASFFSLDKPKYFTISSILGLVLIFVLNLIFIREFGALGAGFSSLISNFVLFLFTLYYLKKSLN